MILDRRQYTAKPGRIAEFWAAQDRWNRSPVAQTVMRHNLISLEPIAGNGDHIVHIYGFESLDQWRSSYMAVYAAHPPEYFATVRSLFLAQQSGFFAPAPLEALVLPLFGGTLPEVQGEVAASGADPARLCVTEEMLELRPGGLPRYWDAWRSYIERVGPEATSGIIGAWFAIDGIHNRVVIYRWFPDVTAAWDHKGKMRDNAAWLAFAQSYEDILLRSETGWYKPSPVYWLRSVLQSVDWTAVQVA
ncbi:hypothetical protein CAF53_03425 [Sphingobium sp. LB126]|uniref:NIPSNAP family protein n=1 Tax=Sphingobium sp. LB126 TaxID=1983755 RepID=UPI000C20F748|nr:NIPSNAP family protein [Sphingobium sp. LB126]PJG47396.1 hypothetical protein CAF53_03425 [Sphingobium sp. LB126]